MASITELDGAKIANLVYDYLSSKVNQPGNTYDDAGNSYTTLAFTPRFQCPGYAQGGIAMLNLSDKSRLAKRVINCTKEETEKFGKRVTCAVGDTNSLGFEEISNSQVALGVDIVDKGLNAPYYELIK